MQCFPTHKNHILIYIATIKIGNKSSCVILVYQQWASSEARARLALQAEGRLDQPIFGVHYDTPENKFEFESKSPDNPFDEDEDDDDGKIL